MSSLPLARSGHWQYLKHYLRPHRPRIGLLAAVLFATIGTQVATPLVASSFINEAIGNGSHQRLINLALVTMLLALVAQVLSVAETWLAETVGWSATNTLRTDLAAHVLRLDSRFHAEHTQGDLIQRVDGDVSSLANFFSRFVITLIGNGLLIITVIVLLLVVDWRIALGLALFVVLALGIMLWIRRASAPSWAAERETTAQHYGFLGEYLAGLEDVRSSGAEPFVMRAYTQVQRTWRRAIVRAQMSGYALFATSEAVFGLAMAFALAICALLYRDNALTLGGVYLVFRYSDMLRRPTEQIRNELIGLQQADASITRIGSLLAEQPRITDGPQEALPPTPLDITFDHVTFGYDSATPVLHDITLHLPAGRILGIAGRTGSGKSTLTKLLLRHLDPDQGTVRLGGTDLRDVTLDGLRSRIGVVSQDVHIFNATVRDNLTLFDPTIPDHRIADALTEIGLGAWLTSLPDGLNTTLGGNSELSAGEAQVLACARILLRDSDVVVLDEASSRLDPATEAIMHQAMSRLLQGRTGVIIAHRLETLALTDDILILADGRVVEFGPRAELAADPSSQFHHLLQIGAGEVLA